MLCATSCYSSLLAILAFLKIHFGSPLKDQINIHNIHLSSMVVLSCAKCGGVLESIQMSQGGGGVTPWTGPHFNTEPHRGKTIICCTYLKFFIYSNVHIFGLRKRKNKTHAVTRRPCKLQVEKLLNGNQTHNLVHCEETVLITVLPSHVTTASYVGTSRFREVTY